MLNTTAPPTPGFKRCCCQGASKSHTYYVAYSIVVELRFNAIFKLRHRGSAPLAVHTLFCNWLFFILVLTIFSTISTDILQERKHTPSFFFCFFYFFCFFLSLFLSVSLRHVLMSLHNLNI